MCLWRSAVPVRHSTRDELRAALCEQCGLEPGDFAPRYDKSYSGRKSYCERGGDLYFPPGVGWVKLALRVPPGTWLHKAAGWPVAYHGTDARRDVVRAIVREGFRVRGGKPSAKHGERLGTGIYCTWSLEKAMKYSEAPLRAASGKYILVFQCRVRREDLRKCEGKDVDIWVVDASDSIRPCAVLLKRLEASDRSERDERRHKKEKKRCKEARSEKADKDRRDRRRDKKEKRPERREERDRRRRRHCDAV